MSWIGIGSALLGGVLQNNRTKDANDENRAQMMLQKQNQMALNKQGHELQMDMWNKTNYGAQKKHMIDAGLNPALMYGKSGGGGATTGGQGGGSAASGGSKQPMDIGAMLQAGLMKAQIKNIDADTEQKKANADSTRGAEGTIGAAEIGKKVAETGTEKQKAMLVEAQRAVEEAKKVNVDTDTKLKGKQIDVQEQERILKKYEGDLNKMGIQKTDNMVFRWMALTASEAGINLGGVVNRFIEEFNKRNKAADDYFDKKNIEY